MKTPSSKKILLWSGISIVTLFIILVIHIVQVTKPKIYDNNTIQLAKIDFTGKLESSEIALIMKNAKTHTGVKSVNYYDIQNSIVVMYDNRILNNDKITAIIKASTTIPSTLFTPSAEMLANSCPIKNKDSYSYKFSMLIKNVFH